MWLMGSSFRIVSVFILICASCAIGVIDHSYFPAFEQQSASKNYLPAAGVIIESRIRYSDRSYRNSVRRRVPIASIRYTYDVNGMLMESTRYRYEWGGRSEEAVVKSFPVGRNVTVFYNPRNFQDAVLSTELNKRDWFFFCLTVGINLFIVFCWLVIFFRRPRKGGSFHP